MTNMMKKYHRKMRLNEIWVDLVNVLGNLAIINIFVGVLPIIFRETSAVKTLQDIYLGSFVILFILEYLYYTISRINMKALKYQWDKFGKLVDGKHIALEVRIYEYGQSSGLNMGPSMAKYYMAAIAFCFLSPIGGTMKVGYSIGFAIFLFALQMFISIWSITYIDEIYAEVRKETDDDIEINERICDEV